MAVDVISAQLLDIFLGAGILGDALGKNERLKEKMGCCREICAVPVVWNTM